MTKEIMGVTSGCVVKNNEKLLLTQRIDGRWEFPKGRIEFEEDPKAAAIRELKEETGLDAKDATFLGYNNSINKYKNTKKHMISFVFLVTKFTGKVTIQKKEVQNHTWVTIDEALKLTPLHHNTLAILIYFQKNGITRLNQ